MRILLLLILIAPAPALALQSQSSPPQIISGAELRQAGVTRLSDLLDLVDGWHNVTMDGFSRRAAPAGLAPLGGAPWTILLDGLPVDIALFDEPNLNLLPVPVTEIERVEVYRLPVLTQGVFAGTGAIHIHTRRPGSGLGLRAVAGAGSEVDDPGPFRYTAHASPNIDRIGPTIGAAVSAGNDAAFIRGTFVSEEHHTTDERIKPRINRLHHLDDRPRLFVLAPSLTAGVDGPAGRHRVIASYTRFQDLLFLDVFGTEIPTDHEISTAGLEGDTGPAAAASIQYQVSYIRHELSHRPNLDTLDLEWMQDRIRGNVEGRFRFDSGEVRLGAGGRQIITGPGDGGMVVITHAQASADLRLHRTLGTHLAAQLAHTDGRLSPKAMLATAWSPHHRHALTARATFARRTPGETNSLWHWTARGSDLGLPERLRVEDLPYEPLAATLTADLGYRVQVSDGLSLSIEGSFRQHYRHYVPDVSFDLTDDGLAFLPAIRLVPNVNGRLGGGTTVIRIRPASSVESRLTYSYFAPISGDALFRAAYGSMPRHLATLSVRFEPVDRFSLYLRARHQSSTHWPEYAPAAAASGGFYREYLPPYVIVDLTARKLFWNDLIAGTLSLRNLLNAPYRSHPAGVVTNMALHGSVRLSLGRLGGE